MSVFCESCNIEYGEGAKFCVECRAALSCRCPSCGAPSSAAAKFCAQCGALIAAPAEDRAERRQLTVMFCDIVGFTTLSEKLDPEDLRDLVQAYQGICGTMVAELDGHIAQFLGDGVLAYFGFPKAHEDDARRAVDSGLRIIKSLSEDERTSSVLKARIGIHTGMTVVGGLRAAGHREQLALGDTPNVAARVQGEASANSVLITETTHRLVAGFFNCRKLPARQLKSLTGESRLFEVHGRSGATSKLDAAALTGLTPFIGRAEELGIIRDHWSQARTGSTQIVEFCGEAGIGKSRLVGVLRGNVIGRDGTFLECRCSPYYQTSALYPFTELIERQLQFERSESDAHKYGKLETWLVSLGIGAEHAAALLGALLSLSTASALPELAPQRQRQLTLAVLSELFRAQAIQCPLLLAVEDLHWADPSTLELIEALIRGGGEHPLLLCLTYRPEFEPSWGDSSNRRAVYLKRFPRNISESIVNSVTRNRALPDEVLELVVSRAEGVPLFVEEFTKAALEAGVLREDENRYELTGPLPQGSIPATVNEMLAARIDRLGEAKPVAHMGATLGREFTYEMLRAVSLQSSEEIDRALLKLESSQLVVRQGAPPNATYTFKHALIRDAAYDSLLRKTRQQYHEHIANTLRQRFPELVETRPELLADHFNGAGLAEQAIDYWQRAAARAQQRAANREAISHLKAALRALDELSDSRERHETELGLQLSLMAAEMAIHGWASREVETSCVRARQLCLQLDDQQRLFAALWGLWTVRFLRGEVIPALEVAEDVHTRAHRTDTRMLHILGDHAMCLTRLYQGEIEASRDLATAGIELFDQETERQIIESFQLSSTVVMYSFLSASQWMLGAQDDARRTFKRCRSLAQELNHNPALAYAKTYPLYFYHFWREPGSVRDEAAAALEFAEREGFVLWRAMAMILLGWGRFESGELDAGLRQTELGLEQIFAIENKIIYIQNMALYGEMLWRVGRVDKAVEALEQGMKRANEHSEHFMEPELYRLRGLIRLERNEKVGAAADFEKSLDIARAQKALSLELRTSVNQGRLLHSDGRHEEARSLVGNVLGRLNQGHEGYDSKRACAFLDELDRLDTPAGKETTEALL